MSAKERKLEQRANALLAIEESPHIHLNKMIGTKKYRSPYAYNPTQHRRNRRKRSDDHYLPDIM